MMDQRERFERAFEVFEMPEPAFERMVGRHDRRRSAQKVATLVLALFLTVVTVAALVRAFSKEQTGRRPSPSPSVVEVSPQRIALRATAKPGGLEFAVASGGISAVTRPLQGSSLEANRAVQRGFVAAFVREFTGPDDSFIGSFAAVFEDDEAAAAAVDVYREVFTTDYGYVDPPTDPGLGTQGVYFEDPSLPRTFTYVWRHGNVVLNVHAFGSLDAATVRAVAETMDTRALRQVERSGP